VPTLWLMPLATITVGVRVKVKVNGAPGVNVTSAVALRLLTAAVTVATPATPN
jgi:hypothetical protein